jgi:fatty acid desaturase
MGKIVRYEFIGNRTILAALTLILPFFAIFFPWILIALVPNLLVYLLLTVVKVEEEIERPNEFIAGFKEGRFTK